MKALYKIRFTSAVVRNASCSETGSDLLLEKEPTNSNHPGNKKMFGVQLLDSLGATWMLLMLPRDKGSFLFAVHWFPYHVDSCALKCVLDPSNTNV